MEVSLLAFFEWCETTAVGHTVKNSAWLFPVIEAVHLLGLSLLGGSLLVLDLRMLGLGLRRPSIAQLAADTRGWLLGSIAVMILTGTALFLSEAVKCYYNPSFWVKMTTLPVALLFTVTVRSRIAAAATHDTTRRTRVTALVSLLLWGIVAAAGRWIGFS